MSRLQFKDKTQPKPIGRARMAQGVGSSDWLGLRSDDIDVRFNTPSFITNVLLLRAKSVEQLSSDALVLRQDLG